MVESKVNYVETANVEVKSKVSEYFYIALLGVWLILGFYMLFYFWGFSGTVLLSTAEVDSEVKAKQAIEVACSEHPSCLSGFICFPPDTEGSIFRKIDRFWFGNFAVTFPVFVVFGVSLFLVNRKMGWDDDFTMSWILLIALTAIVLVLYFDGSLRYIVENPVNPACERVKDVVAKSFSLKTVM